MDGLGRTTIGKQITVSFDVSSSENIVDVLTQFTVAATLSMLVYAAKRTALSVSCNEIKNTCAP